VALGGLAWFVGTQALDAENFAGVAQRVFVTALLLWITTTAGKLYRQLETDESVEVGASVGTTR
jgi:hypothetical protein